MDAAAQDSPDARIAPARLRSTFVRFGSYARGTRLRLLVVTVLASVPAAVEVGQLWIFKDIVNSATAHDGLPRYVTLAVIFGGLAIVEGIALYFGAMMTAYAGQQLVRRLRNDVFAHLHTLSLDFFERRPLGDMLARLTTDVDAVETFLFSGIATGAASVVSLAIGTVALLVLDWRLTLLAAVVTPGFVLLSRLFRGHLADAALEMQRSEGAIVSAGEQALSNAMLVQAYNRGRWEAQRFDAVARRRFAADMVFLRLQSMFTPMIGVIETVGAMVVLGFGIWELEQERLSLGALIAFVAVLSRIYLPIATLTEVAANLYAASASAERLGEILDERTSVPEPAHPQSLNGLGPVELRGVRFRYPGAQRDALRDMDLTIAAGQLVAIVGPSGSGKTTLLKLLLRFYDPSEGSVRIGGVDLRNVHTSTVRAAVAVMLQENLLFDATVADNIAYGRSGADPARIERAAHLAGAHEFIRNLPDGYDTVIGQHGRLLSGGQQRRIALARALIRDPSVLILDEPTAGLDPASSAALFDTLRARSTTQTIIVITHDIEAIHEVDACIHVEHGRVAQIASLGMRRRSPARRTLPRPSTDPSSPHCARPVMGADPSS